ncbi:MULTISPECIES: D-2-hydroxyacid dehydrogenase [unclassified Neptuniibacter]|uniref:D-2-hydroxyacid dehydrogenase n=1 Tax=unclassified Neptuniibacter TaxID=2630693 RepID=UPI000C4D92B6|nr:MULTISPECIES: D-2-hydroxyacid dehydrogenase [unclassified Neptuniibacter]MAY42090.1 glycerate dehydrogenase [Oceanospirillaceae bacterium]|tara:strand:+ start:18324 stop:19301 length:978 start_codon:yes stop_codon:yes gene_type:complete
MRAVILDLKGLDSLDLHAIEALVDELVCYDLTPVEQIANRIEGFDIVITNKTPLTRKVLSAAKGIKFISVTATGTNVIDRDAARELGIPVSNCVAYGVDSVAQHVWSLILALHTNLLSYASDVNNGQWQKSDQFCFLTHPIVELSGRTLGIIGYGSLGKAVAKVAAAFGMNVIVCQKIGQQTQGEQTQGLDQAPPQRLPFAKFLEQADVISLHCPLTDETNNLFDHAVLEKMKPGAFLINAARGGIVNEADLAQALKNGVLAGAAVDVLTVEPPKSGNALLAPNIPNLILTPHIAWGSVEARTRIIQQTAENIKAFMEGRSIRTV